MINLRVLATLFIIALYLPASSVFAFTFNAKKLFLPAAEKIKIVKNVPYICQQGRLDCGYVSCAMLIGHFNKRFDTLSYPKLVFESAGGYGFSYCPGTLVFPFTGWLDETFYWLSSLYGLAYERIAPASVSNKKEAWNDYINRVWDYLQKDIPVQAFRSWSTHELDGRMYTPEGLRPFWWEGILKKHRPDKHALVIVGLDRSRGVVYVNDPGCGWFGTGKAEEIKLSNFRKLTKSLPNDVKYYTRVFYPDRSAVVDESSKAAMITQRIIKKIEGDPLVYDKETEHFLYGLKGVTALRYDLEIDKFSEILKNRLKKDGVLPREVIGYLSLGLYQYAYITAVTAGYLDAVGNTVEFEKMSRLHSLYEELYTLNRKLLSIFRPNPDFEEAIIRSGPVLEELRMSLSELKSFFEGYLIELVIQGS
ncbi:MAG: C39 family peptidase [Candidatus Omnitrophica bacterium]|nr:C39 family peptidase [Candidatus Omnitrophota bacterium]MBU1922715.1 C39 family peptidase [Candidatus Omnitrophota bacterium]